LWKFFFLLFLPVCYWKVHCFGPLPLHLFFFPAFSLVFLLRAVFSLSVRCPVYPPLQHEVPVLLSVFFQRFCVDPFVEPPFLFISPSPVSLGPLSLTFQFARFFSGFSPHPPTFSLIPLSSVFFFVSTLWWSPHIVVFLTDSLKSISPFPVLRCLLATPFAVPPLVEVVTVAFSSPVCWF